MSSTNRGHVLATFSPIVAPPPVHKKQSLQETKARQRVVGRKNGLLSLLAPNPYADVRRLDHCDVVGTITNRERYLPRHVLLDEQRQGCH